MLTMFDHPLFTDGDKRTPSRALHRWEHIKKSIDYADRQIDEWVKHRNQLKEELDEHKEEARKIFKELLE